MGYATVADVAALIKNLDSYTTVDTVEVQRALNEAETEVNNLLDNYYRDPLAIVLTAAEFLTTLTVPTAVGATTCTLAALGTASSPQDGAARWLSVNTAIYFDVNTALQERAVITAIDPVTNICTLAFPTGRSPLTQAGLLYAHASGSNVITSTSLDALFLASIWLAMAIMEDALYSAVDESGKDQQSNMWRVKAIGIPATKQTTGTPGIMSRIADGTIQFFDAIASANRPVYPSGLALGTELAWDGITDGAQGHATFRKEERDILYQDEFT